MPVMSVRARARFLNFVAFPVGCLGLFLLGVFTYEWIVYLAFPYMIIISSLIQRIRCPNCATPVGWHTYKFLGLRFEWWSSHFPKRCEWCGHDLTEKRPKGRA